MDARYVAGETDVFPNTARVLALLRALQITTRWKSSTIAWILRTSIPRLAHWCGKLRSSIMVNEAKKKMSNLLFQSTKRITVGFNNGIAGLQMFSGTR